jgi:hypothetical protein
MYKNYGEPICKTPICQIFSWPLSVKNSVWLISKNDRFSRRFNLNGVRKAEISAAKREGRNEVWSLWASELRLLGGMAAMAVAWRRRTPKSGNGAVRRLV